MQPLTLVAIAALCCAATVVAQDPHEQLASAAVILPSPETAQPAPSEEQTPNDKLTGDWFGRRTDLEERGLTVDASLTTDYVRNIKGGIDTEGSALVHLFDLSLTFQTEPMLGLKGGTLFADFQWQTGQDPADEVGDYQGVSGIAEDGRTQLGAIWYEQAVLDGELRLRVGKMDANADFAISEYGDWFMNGGMGAPANVPLPTFPDNAFGAAVFYETDDAFFIRAGAFDGAAQEGYTIGDEGPATVFGAPSDLFFIAETGTRYTCHDNVGGRLAIGVWRHTGVFDRYDGGSESGTTGVYCALDHAIYRENAQDDQGLSMFVVYGYADPSVAEAAHHASCGLTYKGVIPTRDADSCGVGASWIKFADGLGTAHDSELALETFYEIAVTEYFSIRPDVQYIQHPSGTDLDDAIALSFRISLQF